MKLLAKKESYLKYLVIFAFVMIFILLVENIRVKSFWMDDLSLWRNFDVNRHDFWKFIWSTSANKIRPLFYLVIYPLFRLIDNNTWIIEHVNKLVFFGISFAAFYIFRKISKSWLIAGLLSCCFVASSYSYYILLTAHGILEALALVFSMVILYSLYQYLISGKIGYYVAGLIFFFLLIFTHERFLSLAGLFIFAYLLKDRSIKHVFLAFLPVFFVAVNLVVKLFYFKIRAFDGTGGTSIVETFTVDSFYRTLYDSFGYLLNINNTDEYLNGISFFNCSIIIRVFIILAILCLPFLGLFLVIKNNITIPTFQKMNLRLMKYGLLISIGIVSIILSIYLKRPMLYTYGFLSVGVNCLFGIICMGILSDNKNIREMSCIAGLCSFYILLCIFASSVTIRLEMRWLYVPLFGVYFLLAYLYSLAETCCSKRKLYLNVFLFWGLLTFIIVLYNRSHWKNLYLWGGLKLTNNVYETVIKGKENTFNKTDIIIFSKKEEKEDLEYITDSDYFRQFLPEGKGQIPKITVIDDISLVPADYLSTSNRRLFRYTRKKGILEEITGEKSIL